MELRNEVWKNGYFIPKEMAVIPIFSQGVQYGAGIFEGIRFYKTKSGHRVIFRLKDHLDRFYYSAKEMFIEIPFSIEQLTKAIIETIKKSGLDEGYIRPWAGFTSEKIGLDVEGIQVSCVIGVLDWPAYYSGPLKTHLSPVMRPHPESFSMGAKISGTYVNSIRAHMNAKKHGFNEAILVDYRHFFSEASAANFFGVANKGSSCCPVLCTPNVRCILPGVTRATVLEFSSYLNIDVEERDMRSAKGFDELFLCGTAAEIASISHFSGRQIGDGKIGPTTKKLQKLYKNVVCGEIKKFRHWLTFVD